jgi:hypothetical protein
MAPEELNRNMQNAVQLHQQGQLAQAGLLDQAMTNFRAVL